MLKIFVKNYSLKMKSTFSCVLPFIILVMSILGCTKNSYFQSEEDKFTGIADATIDEQGQVTLSWKKISLDGATYQVFRRTSQKEFDWNTPFESTQSTSIKVPKFTIDSKFCFAVRFQKEAIAADTNTVEKCTSFPYIDTYEGIQTLTSDATGVADLTWNAAKTVDGEIEGYRIYKDAEFKVLATTVSRDKTSASVGDLQPDTLYSFGVRAFDKYGREDSNSKTMSVKIANNATPVFQGPSAISDLGSQSLKITWLQADSKVDSFRVYRGVGLAGTTPAVDYTTPVTTIAGTLLTYTATGLGDDLTYCYDVRAASSGGQESTNATPKCLTFADAGAPTFNGISTIVFEGGKAKISWTPSVSQTSQYRVYYQEGSTLDFSTALYQTLSNSNYPATQLSTAELSGLAGDRAWTFAVRALDRTSQMETNTTKITKVAGDLQAPIFLGMVSATALDENRISLEFNRSTETDLQLYRLKIRKTSVGGTYSTSTSVNQPSGTPATVTGTITGLEPATNYDILVVAVDSSGNESSNTLATVRATLDLTPPTFSGVSAVSLSPVDGSKTRVSWNPASDSSGIAGYRIFYSTGSLSGCALILNTTLAHPRAYANCSAQVAMSSLVTSASYLNISGLTEGSTYRFLVRAIDNAGNVDPSTAEIAFNIPYYTPPSPPTVSIVGGNGPSANNTITVTGTGGNGNTVKVYVNGSTTASGTATLNGTTTYNITIVLPNTSATYAITGSQVNLGGIEGTTSTAVNYVLMNSAPVATLSGTPCTTSGCYTNASALNVTVAGANVVTYQYSVLSNQSTSCSAASYNGTWISVATSITTATGNDGPYRLCVKGRNAASVEQESADATVFNFTRSTTPPAAPNILTYVDSITNSSTITYNGTMTVTVQSTAGAAYYCVKGAATAPTTPTADDSCWTNSTTVTASLTATAGSTTSIRLFGWSKDEAANISTSASQSSGTISYTNLCTSGTLADTCTVSSSRTLASGGGTIAGTGSLVIASGGNIVGAAQDSWVLTVQGNITVQSSGTLTGNYNITTTNLTVQSGGTVTCKGLGYAGTVAQSGSPATGGGTVGVSNSYGGGGGGHGGTGGVGYGITSGGGATFGSASAPVTWGGSGGDSGSGSTAAGGAGGGALKLTVSGVLTNNGTINADGNNSANYSAAGAGGSIWVIAGSTSGNGNLFARGGGNATSVQFSQMGGGGGGRISVTSSNSFKGNIDVTGGVVSSSSILGRAQNGSTGTIYTNYTNPCDSGNLSTTCTINSTVYLGSLQTFSANNVVIASGGSLRSEGPQRALTLNLSGTLTVQSGGSILANLSDVIATTMTIDSGGTVSADAFGFAASSSTNPVGNGAGVCRITATYGCGGGGHGGDGGFGSNALSGKIVNTSLEGSGGAPHGTFNQPTSFGGNGSGNFSPGGVGGGAIKISATTLVVNGTLSVNGSSGVNTASTATYPPSGGGAGGSLWLNVTTLSGSGAISATGGAGATNAAGTSGGGSGGRIASYHTNQFSGTISIAGGTAGGGSAGAGQPGVAFFANNQNQYCNSGLLSSGTCTISQVWALRDTQTISGTNVTLEAGGRLFIRPTESATLNLTGDLTIQSTATIAGNISVTAANIYVNSGASIVADGTGFQGVTSGNGNGTGFGNNSNHINRGAGGGAHGGAGGNGAGVSGANGQGGTAYGTASAPTTFGSSGGATSTTSVSGSGGGAIKLSASSALQINGTLSANGDAGAASGSNGLGGGAGGSIWLIAGTLSGSGSVTANGGAGGAHASYAAGGGSGGRIKVTATTDSSSFAAKTATGGAAGGAGATAGAAGTVQ